MYFSKTSLQHVHHFLETAISVIICATCKVFLCLIALCVFALRFCICIAFLYLIVSCVFVHAFCLFACVFFSCSAVLSSLGYRSVTLLSDFTAKKVVKMIPKYYTIGHSTISNFTFFRKCLTNGLLFRLL